MLALHLLAAALWPQLGAWRDRHPAAPAQPPLVVVLLPPSAPPPRVLTPPRSAATHRPPRPPAAVAPDAQPRRPDAAAVLTPGGIEPQAVPVPSPAAAAAATARHSGPGAALNLALPRAASAPWRRRNPALDDPRSNTAPSSLEQRLADAMGGDGAWVEEAIDADHRRLRRGNTCVYLQRPRAAQIDPFTPGNRALPWQAGAPVTCR